MKKLKIISILLLIIITALVITKVFYQFSDKIEAIISITLGLSMSIYFITEDKIEELKRKGEE